MTFSFKKIAVSSLAALAIIGTLGAAPAEAGWGGGGWHRGGWGGGGGWRGGGGWHRGGWGGGGVGLGIIGGLAAGAIIASQSRPYYQRYGYYDAGGDCYLDRRPVVNRWGDIIGYRNVQVCN